MKLYALIITAFLSTPSFAAEVSIEMLNKDASGNRMVYSQEVATVEIGDTVTWLPTSKGHNVEMICLLYTSPSPRDRTRSRMPSSA